MEHDHVGDMSDNQLISDYQLLIINHNLMRK